MKIGSSTLSVISTLPARSLCFRDSDVLLDESRLSSVRVKRTLYECIFKYAHTFCVTSRHRALSYFPTMPLAPVSTPPWPASRTITKSSFVSENVLTICGSVLKKPSLMLNKKTHIKNASKTPQKNKSLKIYVFEYFSLEYANYITP